MKDIDVYDIPKIKLDKTPRPAQIKLLEFTKECVLGNKKFIIIDAPTGLGKSIFAVMAMDWYKQNYNRSSQFDVLTNSKILQEQYTKDFDFMQSLWGVASYSCGKHESDCSTGAEWNRIQNTKCEDCPYQMAKARFEMADVALTNYHLFLTYHLYMPMAWKRSSNVLIIDEADTFENIACDFITTTISKPLLKRNGFLDEEIIRSINLFGKYPEDLDASEFVRIVAEEFLPIVKSVINRLSREAEAKNMQAINYLKSLGNNFLKWEKLQEDYNGMPDNWIVEIELIKKKSKDGVPYEEYFEFIAQPIWAYPYLEEKIWSKYEHVIFMSGTILDKTEFCFANGINIEQASYISMESPFPNENRPIYYFSKTGKQTFKTKELVWTKQKEVLAKILKKHKKQKGILHTTNYEIQSWVIRDLQKNNRLLTHDSINRSEVLQHHYNSDEPTVLVSPSMHTGIDLTDDYGRFSVIIKIPYPNLDSKKIKKRMETRSNYYSLTTVRNLVQSFGRCNRHISDVCLHYVLDSCFGDVIKYSKHYFPQYILDCIQYVD